jgi:hypothetical protein
MGNFAGQRIDFQNGQRRALRISPAAVCRSRAIAGIVDRQMFNVA